ncbi:NAD(P)H-binding protein [Nonomuraea thailandensis]
MPEGVRHSAGDLGDPASLKAAFDGAEALFLLVAGHEPRAVLEAAAAGGVRRVVLLSSQGAGTRPGLYGHPAGFEEAVRGSGLDWTILRPGGFASNALAWAEPISAHRTAAAPFADVALPVIDPADIAEVASVVLRQDGHAGRTYVLTGPQPVTPRERAATIGKVLGAEVRFVEQSRQEARAQMLGFMPEQAVEGTLAILGTPTEEEQRVSPDVERLLGRAPRPFTAWAARNIEAFR